MDGYILDTSVLSALLDPGHGRHVDIRQQVRQLEQNAALFLSSVAFAELQFGVKLAKTFGHRRLPTLTKTVVDARRYRVLNITHHTATAYAELKTTLAATYLAKAIAKGGRPRWIEDWVDKATGKKLQIDENDLWICAQAKERNFLVCTADEHMKRIPNADSDIRLHII